MNQNSFFSYLILFLSVLTGYSYFAHDFLDIPDWLHVAGRMHPMILHFPIALFVLLGLVELLRNKIEADKIRPYLTWLTAFTSLLSALMGLFLSTESGYTGDAVELHKNLGVGLALLAVILYYTSLSTSNTLNSTVYTIGLMASIPVLLIGSHQGASITHGKNYLLEPIQQKEEVVALSGVVYDDFIFPIIKDKCLSCHNSDKTKGEFNMESYEQLLAGGENGESIIPGNAELSLLLKRILLPMDHDEHMPPEGKSQPDQDEIELIQYWIEVGAQKDLSIDSLDSNHPLRKRIESNIAVDAKKVYDFEPVGASLISKLNGPFIHVNPVHSGSPALEASIFIRKTYDPAYLQSLDPIKKNIVKLYLRDLPIQDKDLENISTYENLEELVLNETDISGDNLETILSNKKLVKLSVSDTKIDLQDLLQLKDHTSLQQVYIWNTSIDEDDLTMLKEAMPGVKFYLGIAATSMEPIALSPPILENKKSIVQIDEDIILEHQIPNTKIIYSLDGSEPTDSSLVYNGPIRINDFTILKAKATKEGWLSSETAIYTFYVSGIPIQDVVLTNPPAKQYSSQGGNTIIDQQKGDINDFGNNRWLGYQDHPFSALIDLGPDKKPIEKIILSYGRNMDSYIMPPTRIEVLAGNSANTLKPLKQIKLPSPKRNLGNAEVAFPIELGESNFQYYQVNAYPVTRLPSWHRGAGDKGWVFVDELFVY